MKLRNVLKRYGMLSLQLFAEEPEGNGSDDGAEEDEEDPEDEPEDEHRFTQADIDKAIEKRLARERRKWQREQEKADGSSEAGKKPSDEDQKQKIAADEVGKYKMKIACYEADVTKEAVDDVSALARAYMEADEDLDVEEAIEKVVKKYPQFTKVYKAEDDEEEGTKRNKDWAERASGGKSKKRLTAVEERFYELNPDLKH